MTKPISGPRDKQSSVRRMTPERLRRETNAGNTGDKAAHPDPAIAPLGTDEEAGGGQLIVSEDDIRRATSPPPERPGPHKFFIWGFSPLYVIIGFVALGLTFGALALFSGSPSP